MTRKRVGVPRLPHLLGIEGLAPEAISGLLDLSETYIDQNRSIDKRRDVLAGLGLATHALFHVEFDAPA